jgi:DNA-binding SARP family transcriptional activator
VEFLVLGPLEVVDEGRRVPVGSPKQRRLLAALLAHPNEVVSVDRLADILWGDEPPADAVATLQTYVSRLRAELERHRRDHEEPRVLTRPPGYVLRVAPDELDSTRFERLVAEARDHERAPANDTSALDAALGLWRGPAFAEFADEDFARGVAARLEELRLAAAEDRIDRRLASGRHDELVGELEATVRAHPLRERAWGQLMLALYRSGRQAEALRAYQACRRQLGEELGIEPSTPLRELEAAMVRQSAELDWAAAAPAPVTAGPAAAADLPAGTVTFLFTDLEDSTRLWDEHPDAMGAALERHDAILRQTVDEQHGRIVKMTGDGAHAVFTSAPAAVAAATQALRALDAEAWGATGPLHVRMAVHTGDAETRDGDYFGPVLNRASRLMAAAHGGQVVLSQVTGALVRAALPDGVVLVDLGEHRLRGLTEPEHVFQLTIAGLPSRFPPLQSIEAFPPRLPLPEPAFPRVEEQFAGRDVELRELEAAWSRARDGVRQIALVAGEPGIGKTRLSAELARRVQAGDGVVLYGRCDEEAIVPYQPFVEALRHTVAAYAPATLHERLHGLEQDLARVFPELRGRLSEPSPSVPNDPESERYRLFEAITALLTGVTAARSALLVLDDLHWADRPTLLLLRHLVRSVPHAPLLVVGCYREMELAPDHPLADLVADLRREPAVTWVALDGLSEEETRTLLQGLAQDDVGSAFSAALHRETGGNPLFLEELLRHLMETHRLPLGESESALADIELPAGVRDVVARRLRRLPDPVNDVLSLAAVVGFEFDAPLVGRAVERSPDEVLDALDQATDARLVRSVPGRVGRYAFSHVLIRQTVYQALGAGRRAQLHARVGAAMELEADGRGSAAALAQHFIAAMPLAGAAKAIEYTTRAGRQAVADLALEDAVAYFEQAMQLREEHAPADSGQRVELLTDLAEALVPIDEAAGVDAALRAVDAARAGGTAEQFGRAVAVFAAPFAAVMSYPDRVAALLDDALHELGDAHPSLRARLLAIEAFKYSAYQLQGRDGRALAKGALRLARQVGDPATLAATLFARATSLESTAETTERLALGEELVALGRSQGLRAAQATVQGLRVLAGVHLELGDADALSSTIAELARTGEERRWLPAFVFAAQWRATQALLEGRFDDVRDCWGAMRQYARAFRVVVGMESQQAFYLAREQGELEAVIAPLQQVAGGASGSLLVPSMLAVAQLDTGHEDAALRTLDSLDAEDLRQAEPETAWGLVLAQLAEVAAACGSTAQASLLYELLTPFAGRLVTAFPGLACLGAAERYQGMLSTKLERWDEAEAHFEHALALERKVRGRALVPRTCYWQAQLLSARARPGDDRRARAILRDVMNDTAAVGMRRLHEQAELLLSG